MIKEIFTTVKKSLIKSELDKLNSIKTELEHLNSKERYLHNHYETHIATIVKDDIRKAFEDAHFEDVAEIYKAKKQLRNEFDTLKIKYLSGLADNKLKYNKYLSKSLGKKRIEMPQITKSNILTFAKNFDDIGVIDTEMKLNEIKPAQDEFNNDKVLHFINEYLENDPDNIYIVSQDGYLIDGHHRWAAELQLMPENKTVKVKQINLPAEKLIEKANELKFTKQKDVDDKTFRKSIKIIAKAIEDGFIQDDLKELIKGKAGLVPVRRIVVKNGVPFSQIFWVKPDKNTNIDDTTIKENKLKNEKLFTRQQADDRIANVGDIVDANYIGKNSKKHFQLKNLKIVKVKDDYIEVEVPKQINTSLTYDDGMQIIFRKGAILKIPKTTSPDWSSHYNYKLRISDEERQARERNLHFLEEIRDYVKEAKKKGYSIYADVENMTDAQIEARYAPFFAKYGYKFDPIRMFDNAKKAIKERFRGVNLKYNFVFTTNGFKIDVYDKDTNAHLMHTTRGFVSGDDLLPGDLNKGIYHSYFKIYQVKYWGGGLAKKLFSAYYHEYKRMGLQFMGVQAGLESGPFVWPDYGFRGTYRKAEQVLDKFTPGASRDIKKYYIEIQDSSVERAWKDGNKIYIKYIDSEEPINVTNEKIKREDGTEVKKYDVDSQGFVHIPEYATRHTITEKEQRLAMSLYHQWREKHPNEPLFPFTVWTGNPKLRNASKVALLNAGGAHYAVNLTHKPAREDFERRIKYKQWLKENNIKDDM